MLEPSGKTGELVSFRSRTNQGAAARGNIGKLAREEMSYVHRSSLCLPGCVRMFPGPSLGP